MIREENDRDEKSRDNSTSESANGWCQGGSMKLSREMKELDLSERYDLVCH